MQLKYKRKSMSKKNNKNKKAKTERQRKQKRQRTRRHRMQKGGAFGGDPFATPAYPQGQDAGTTDPTY